MTVWYEEIVTNEALRVKMMEGLTKYRDAELKFARGKRVHRPALVDFIDLYKGPDGRVYDWWKLHEMYADHIRREVKRLLNNMEVPPVTSRAFQNFMLAQLNQKDAFADFIDLPLRDTRLLDYLKRISTKQEDGCTGQNGQVLLAHQAVVYAMARLRAAGRIRTPGLLAMHSTGAGKTLEGLCAILAFWNKKTSDGMPYALMTVSTRSNQSSNDLSKLGALASTFFGSRFVNELEGIDRLPFQNKTGEEAAAVIRRRMLMGLETIAASPDAFELLKKRNRNDVYTYTTLANDCKKGLFARGDHVLHHALVIVDEIQFLLAPPSDEMAFSKEYARLRQFLTSGRDPSTTWVLGMTATPGSTAAEVGQVLDVIKAREGAFNPGTDLAVAARGLISVAQVEGDLHHFPVLKVEAKCVKLKPGSLYAQKYMTVASQFHHLLDGLREVGEDIVALEEDKILQKEEAYKARLDRYDDQMRAYRSGKGKKKPRPVPAQKPPASLNNDPSWTYMPKKRFSFYKKLREASNYLIERGSVDEMEELQKEFEAQGVWSFIAVDGTCRGNVMLMALSPKLRKLVENIKQSKGKHYVYTSDPMTLMLLATVLEIELGMAQVTVNLTEQAPIYQAGKRHFGLINKVSSTRKLRGGFPMSRWAYMTRPEKQIKVVKAAVNESSNLHGEQVAVVLATKENYKGVDLKGLRFIHMIEPMPDFSDFIQLVGRGPRFCSHAGLKPITSWSVKLISYRLIVDGIDDFVQADTHVYNESVRRFEAEYGATTNTDLQKASVDYLVFKNNLHVVSGKQRQQLMSITCDKQTDTKKKGSFPAMMTAGRKEQLRKKREHQKALIAARRRQ